MPDYDTLTELLVDQSERKLKKLRANIVGEIERLGVELKVVDAALAQQARAADPNRPVRGRGRKDANGSTGRFDGLSRRELFEHALEMNKPAFKPTDLRDYLITKGIVRRVEAVRNSLVRLVEDGLLERTSDGQFAVPVSNGNGAENQTEEPVAGNLSLVGPGLQT
jgi:hypothetical protein